MWGACHIKKAVRHIIVIRDIITIKRKKVVNHIKCYMEANEPLVAPLAKEDGVAKQVRIKKE